MHADTSYWIPTRSEAQRRLEDFLPRAGRDYTRTRNFDYGPDDRSNVSALSPFVRHRLILEEEIVAETLDRYSLKASEKFIQEVCWRTYWKGWLEMRPSIWRNYDQDVREFLNQLQVDSSLRLRVEEATSGKTGITCFDAWSNELIEYGYLHNHTRMWFASIWIFTLGLPWQLGADFFIRYLIDGDPASNTLSWRWVAGLQTIGKTYKASPDNIATYTSGRFRPGSGELATDVEAIKGRPIPKASSIPRVEKPSGNPCGLLLTEDDLHPESLKIEPDQVKAARTFNCTRERSPLPVGRLPLDFTDGAIADASERSASHFGVAVDPLSSTDPAVELIEWARAQGLAEIVTPYAPVGPARDQLDRLRPTLEAAGIRIVPIRRAWDEAHWPHATRGYFPFKEKLPKTIAMLGLGHGNLF